MINKMKCMFSRLAAPFLKPTLAILAACIVGGAWAGDDLVWGNADGNFSSPSSWTSVGDLTGYESIYDWKTDALGKNLRFDANASGKTVTMDIYDDRVWNCWFYNGATPVIFDSSDDSKGFTAYWGIHLSSAANDVASLTVKNGSYSTPAQSGDNASTWAGGDNAKVTLNLEGGKIDLWGATGGTSLYVTKGNGVESVINISGGTLAVCGGDMKIGASGDNTSSTTITISNGGVLSCGTDETAHSLNMSAGGTTQTTIDIEEGGVLAAWQLVRDSSGQSVVNLKGGTLQALGVGTSALVGSEIGIVAGEKGGIIDTDGHNISISGNVTGAGAIFIKGTGSVDFSAADLTGFTGVIVSEENGGTVTLPAGIDGSHYANSANTLNCTGVVDFKSGVYAFNNMAVSGASGNVTASGATLKIATTGSMNDPEIGNGDGGSLTISDGTVYLGIATSVKWTKVNGGTINLNGGELQVGSIRYAGGSPVVNFNGGTLYQYGNTWNGNEIIENNGNWTLNVLAGGAKIYVPEKPASNYDGATTTISQELQSGVEAGDTDGGLTKLGPGTLILAVAPTFNGGITLHEGSIVIPSSYDSAKVTTDVQNYFVAKNTDGSTSVYTLEKVPATCTWNGSSSTSWADPDNWENGEVPTSKDIAIFPAGAVVVMDSDATVASVTGNGDLTLNGTRTLSVTGDINVDGTLTVSDMTLDATGYTIAATTLNLNASKIAGNNNDLPTQTRVIAQSVDAAILGSGILQTSGVVSFDGESTFAGNITATGFSKTSSGVATLYGSNAIGGAVVISAGTLKFGMPYKQGTINYNFDFSNEKTGDFPSSLQDANGGTITLSADNSSPAASIASNEAFGDMKVAYSTGLALTTSAYVLSENTFMVWMRNDDNTAGSWSAYPMRDNDTSGSGHKNTYVTHNSGSIDNAYCIRVGGSTWATTATVSINGVPSSKDFWSKQLLSVSGNGWVYGTGKARFGGNKDCCIGEILSLSTKLTLDQRKAIEDYMMDKWDIGDKEYKIIQNTADISISGGAILDLGGFAQTVASVSVSGAGIATVQNGELTITSPISLEDGQILKIPAGSTYTLAEGVRSATADGVTTLSTASAHVGSTPFQSVQAAIDAIVAGTATGTLTIHESATVNLSTTAASITDVVLDDGVNLDFAANLPWEGSYSNGTIVNQRVASTFVWTPQDSSTDWGALANWTIGGAVATALPGENDTVEFPSADNEWAVELSSDVVVAAVRFEGATTLSGALILSRSVSGSATVTLDDASGFGSNQRGSHYENMNIVVTASESSPAQFYAYGFTEDKTASPQTIASTCKITGVGAIKFLCENDQGQGSGIAISADLSEFDGVVLIPQALNGAHRDNTKINSDGTSERATWKVSNSLRDPSVFLEGNNKVFYFGAYSGSMSQVTPSRYGVVAEIGKLNSLSDSVSGALFSNSNLGRLNESTTWGTVIKKVGIGILTVTAKRARSYEVASGTIVLESDDALRTFWGSDGKEKSTEVEGGGSHWPTVTFSGNSTLALGDSVTVDPTEHNQIVVAEGVSFAISSATTRTFANAIGSGTTGGFTKKGSGTLTLSQPPAYTGATTVEGGVLYIVEGYSPTLAAGTVEMVSDKTGYKKYMPAAAAVAHVDNLYYPTFAEAWAAAGNDDNAAWIYLDSELAQNDIVTLDTAWQRVRVANGTYSADGHIAISSSLANVVLKTSLGAEMTEYTAYPTVTVTVVPGVGVASGEIAAGYISKDGATYTIYSGAQVTITWTAAEGYEFAGGESTATTVISPTENVTPECPAATAVVVGSVTISAPTVGEYGNDFAKVTVTAGVTSTYPAATTITYTLKANGTAIATTTAAGDATSVTFTDANVSSLTRYGNISYTVEASGDNVTDATSDATTAMFADTIGWVKENYQTTTTAAAGGAWQTAVTYDSETHKAAVVDNRFSATNCTTGDVVTVTIDDVVYTSLSDLTSADTDAQGAVAVGGTEESPKFMLLTKQGDTVGWYVAAGVTPVLAAGVTPVLENEVYDIVMTFDYISNTYTVTVNGTPLTVNNIAAVPLAKAQKSVKDIDFLGAGTITAIKGVQYEGKMAIDQNGRKYVTVAEALEANASVKGAVIKLLHDSATTSAEGWNFDSDTKTFVKKVIGLIFLAF